MAKACEIGVISDIHGNQYAFQAFLSAIEGLNLDAVAFCGDIFGYYYGQDSIINDLRRMDNLYAVKGNHDEYFLNLIDRKISKTLLCKKYGNTYAECEKLTSSQNIEWIRSLPCSLSFTILGNSFLMCHGTPKDTLTDRLYPNDNVDFIDLSCDFLLLGHTHYRMLKRVNKTIVVNPGSLGQPRDKNGFGYAIISLPSGEVKYKNIYFDREQLEGEIQHKDPLYPKLIELLHRGDK
jgi:putative phosphoesterase